MRYLSLKWVKTKLHWNSRRPGRNGRHPHTNKRGVQRHAKRGNCRSRFLPRREARQRLSRLCKGSGRGRRLLLQTLSLRELGALPLFPAAGLWRFLWYLQSIDAYTYFYCRFPDPALPRSPPRPISVMGIVLSKHGQTSQHSVSLKSCFLGFYTRKFLND